MNVLFIHQGFPAQFGRLGLELNRRYGWQCRFLVKDLSNCPPPSREMLDRLDLAPFDLPSPPPGSPSVPWPQAYGRYLELCQAVLAGTRARPEPRPDLVVAHGGQGPPTL